MNFLSRFIVVLLMVCFIPELQAQEYVFLEKLTADTPMEKAEFGLSVGFDGRTIVVGAPGEDEGKGAAYVFIYRPLLGEVTRIGRLASTSANVQAFGYSVAVKGDLLVVGAPLQPVVQRGIPDPILLPNAGVVYVYRRVFEGPGMTVWEQEQVLIASDPEAEARFGIVVALNETYILVGAPMTGIGGAAYFFKHDGEKFVENTKLETNIKDHRFGSAVAIGEHTAVIGAPQVEGTAYLAHEIESSQGGTGWLLDEQLRPKDPKASAFFGGSVAISSLPLDLPGSFVVVGDAPSGADIFTNLFGEWTWQDHIADLGTNGNPGWRVGIQETTIFVSDLFADGAQTETGKVFRYGMGEPVVVTETRCVIKIGKICILPFEVPVEVQLQWELQPGSIHDPDGASGDFFGMSLAPALNGLVVGASTDEVNGLERAGSASLFIRSGGEP